MKTRKKTKLFLLPKKFSRKSYNKNTKNTKKQSGGGIFLESAAIILGMKYILNRKAINEQWKTGVKPSKKVKELETDKPKTSPQTETLKTPEIKSSTSTQVTVDDIKTCFEKNTANIKESIELVMRLFFTKVIKMDVNDFREDIKEYLYANPTDPFITPTRTYFNNVPNDKMNNILDSITGSPTTENITYYSPNSPVYEWITNDDEKKDIVTDITNKIIDIYLDKTGIDVTYLYTQINCDNNGGSDKNFFICNREGDQNHFDVLYRSNTEEMRFKIPDSGYCLFAALSLIYIIEKLNINVPADLTQHLDANMYGPI